MAENSNIEWTDHTANLWWGCAKVHTGCKNCYAETLANRFGGNIWGEKTERKRILNTFKDLNKFQRQAAKAHRKDRVFVGSMMDIFEENKFLLNPSDEFEDTNSLRYELFKRIQEGKYNNLIFLFLTKRPENIKKFVPPSWFRMIPKNVWFGTSISDQETAKYADELRKCRDNHLFLSIEPQVGEITELNLTHIDWVIQGGESGHGKRPFDINWAYKMKEICAEQNTPFFFKQIDKVQPIPDDLLIRELPTF